jgi:hypothetical protein
MFLMVFALLVIVSMPIVAIVLVSVASKREDAAGTLGGPAEGGIQIAARRVLDFHSDLNLRPATGARLKVGRVIEEAEESPILVAASALALRSAA